MISTRTLVVIGTNGVGKSSFGKDLLKRYPEKAQNICGLHALFITTQEDKANANDWWQMPTLINERMRLPRITEYEKNDSPLAT